jgi:hypothetical protein
MEGKGKRETKIKNEPSMREAKEEQRNKLENEEGM